MISANIPFFKLQNPNFKRFIEAYTGQKVPDESTLRKNYLNVNYTRIMDNVRKAVGKQAIFVQVDETIDVEKRAIINCVVGILNGCEDENEFLINCEAAVNRVDSNEICQFFDRSLKLLYPNGIPTNKVLLFLSDAAPYMVKAGKMIRAFYPKCIHVTCLCHALHKTAEEVQKVYKDVNTLISETKKVFLKSPLRIRQFKSEYPNLALPPEPVLTRWGTWLTAVDYYSQHFNEVQQVVNSFDPEDAACIKTAQEIFSKETVKCEIAYIKSNFCFLAKEILLLETRGLKLADSINCLKSVQEKLKFVTGPTGALVYKKLKFVIDKNTGLETIKQLNAVICGKKTTLNIENCNLSPNEISIFAYAPITSVSVERSFSRYKHVLTSQRRRFTMENLSMYIVTYVNSIEKTTDGSFSEYDHDHDGDDDYDESENDISDSDLLEII